MLNPVASTIIVVVCIIAMVVFCLAMAAIALALQKLNTKLEEITVKVDPILIKTDQVLTITNEKIHALGDRAEGILAQGEEVAESVHEKVDRTASTVQRAVHAPLINVNALAAGVQQGIATFGKLQQRPAETTAAGTGVTAIPMTTNGHSHPAATAEPVRAPIGKE